MSRNPYQVPRKKPSLRPSVFAFVDILGYMDLVQSSTARGQQEATLRTLHAALTKGRKGLEDKDLPSAMRKLGKKDFYALKAFTDNIAIGWPINDDAEVEFGNAFMRLRQFQFQMTIDGFFLRGALSVGDAYVDEIAVFGDALTEAYIGESKIARDPRIILTNSAVAVAKHHLTYYPNPANAPHVSHILKDSDGQWFLNYLDCVLDAEYEYGPFYHELLQHKDVIELNLGKYKSNPPVWSKYAWVASYHNYFCDAHPNHFNDEHRVNVDLFRATPRLIIDAEA